MEKKSFIVGVGLAIVAIGLMTGCSNTPLLPNVGSEKIKVVASFYPVANFVRQVAGDRAEVSVVIPEGMEPHDYEPKPHEITQIFDSRLFVYNGAGLEPWADRIRSELEAKAIQVLRLSDSVELLSGVSGQKTENEMQSDPHIWLDPVSAQKQVESIRDALVSIDPSHASDYRENSADFVKKLGSLDADFSKGLSSCEHDTVLLSHAAFQYLAKRYGFKTMSISGLSPEEEPSPGDFADLVDVAKGKGIHYIFFEKRANPKLAETLASEIKGETLDMFHIDGGFTPEEAMNPNLYLEQMRLNLQQLRKALGCD